MRPVSLPETQTLILKEYLETMVTDVSTFQTGLDEYGGVRAVLL